jgi:acetyltransferase-like isoleucine patch superfamily enzyme
MKITKTFCRLFWLFPGLIHMFVRMAKDGARDLDNKARFQGAIVDPGCCIDAKSSLGRMCHVLDGGLILNSRIGCYSYVGRHSVMQNCTVGNYCSIAESVILGLGCHPLDRFSTSPVFYRRINCFHTEIVSDDPSVTEFKLIEVGNDVWIGARAVVMDGVKIGNGAVIAAGAVVTRDVPPYAIVAGVPARILRYRADESRRRLWAEKQWWNLAPEDALCLMGGEAQCRDAGTGKTASKEEPQP